MLDVGDGLLQQLADVIVVQRVDDAPSVAVPGDQPEMAQQAQLVRDGRALHADRVSDSCGYSVPLYEYVGQRSKLLEWADHHAGELDEYRAAKNATSIDGLPAF